MSVKIIASDEHDVDIARYEVMPLEEVNAELARVGIDPKRIFDSVNAFVRQRDGRDRPRRRR